MDLDEKMPTMNAAICDGVVAGTCVSLDSDCNIAYAGPIATMPHVSGLTVLMNKSDYDKLESLVKKRRN